jgi:radical SAM protein with 4Fe4S-binding SPASM domain
MGSACCDQRDERIKQYQLKKWKIKNTDHKIFSSDNILFTPRYIHKKNNGIHLFIDPQSPNWMSVNTIGAEVLRLCNGKRTLSDIQEIIANKYKGSDTSRIAHDVSEFVNAAGLMEFISDAPLVRQEYAGRSTAIAPHKLDELWIYYTLACNLRCKHCLVSAGKALRKELSAEEIIKLVDEAVTLGVKRFYITGGEPFIKEGIFDLIRYITKQKKRELIILTNATLFDEKKIASLKKLNNPKLIIQVSLEGPTAAIHDKLRGRGSFEKAVEGTKRLIDIGITPVVSTAISKYNEKHIPSTSKFLSKLGIKEHNILWMHAKGRSARNVNELYVPSDKIARTMKNIKKVYREQELILDNVESLKVRVRTKRGRKNDLCNNCYEKICINSDGHVYPCASLNGDPKFDAGSIRKNSLKDIWLNSKVMKNGRANTVQMKNGCSTCDLKFFCGGGCTSHSFYASEVDTGKGSVLARDPYCSTYKELLKDILWELASEGVASGDNGRDYSPPLVYNAMDAKLPAYLRSSSKSIDKSVDVGCYHCSCVLSVDVEDDEEVCKPEIKGHVTKTVKKKFSKAAHMPVKDYYCPTGYNPKDLAHIPNEVLEVSYGCAKKLGEKGKVIGIDMTDEMVDKATESAEKVAESLGYNVVDFRRGNIMELPVDENSVDLVISNCVINLTEDKTKVLDEIFRILKPNGRFIISDIVSDKPVPGYMKRDKELWNACLSGALTDKRFREAAENAGFPDVTLTRNYLYKKVEYINFYSVTMKAAKPKQVSCEKPTVRRNKSL